MEIVQGIPQGSILDPILFLSFVNDVLQSITGSTLNIYAYDATLFESSNWADINNVSQTLNDDLKSLKEWFDQDRMFIDTQKTKLVIGNVCEI